MVDFESVISFFYQIKIFQYCQISDFQAEFYNYDFSSEYCGDRLFSKPEISEKIYYFEKYKKLIPNIKTLELVLCMMEGRVDRWRRGMGVTSFHVYYIESVLSHGIPRDKVEAG